VSKSLPHRSYEAGGRFQSSTHFETCSYQPRAENHVLRAGRHRKSSTPHHRPYQRLQWHIADTEDRRRRLRPEHLLRPHPHELGHRRQQPKSGGTRVDPIRSSSSTTASLLLSDRTLVLKEGDVTWAPATPLALAATALPAHH